MSQKIIFNIDDFCDNEWGIMEYLNTLKNRYPDFRVTLFTVPFKISTENLLIAKETGWIELAVHGFNHIPDEMLILGKEEILEGFSKVDFSIFTKGFRAPYWLLNEQVIECCNKFGLWVALHHQKNESSWRTLCEHGYYYPKAQNGFKCWYGHTYDIREKLSELLEIWPEDQKFGFVSEAIQKEAIEMIKLNLGGGINPLKGFINLDIQDLASRFPGYTMKVWNFREGLNHIFKAGSVDAATVSHALMYLKVEEYLKFFIEVYVALKPGGVFRITEDNCENPDCQKYGLPWHNPASITGPNMMQRELMKVGFEVYHVGRDETRWKDKSLIQHFHGHPPRVFHMEAIKPMEEKKEFANV